MWSFIFSPTSECMDEWVEMLWQWVVTRHGNVRFLDDIVENEGHMLALDTDLGESTIAAYVAHRSIATMFGGPDPYLNK
jgi:hypothetical protein